MKREALLVKNTAIIALGTFSPKILATISLPIVTARLTKTEFGTYDLINILESLFLPLITLQVQTAAFRFLIECRKDRNRQKTIVTTMLCFVCSTSLVALVVMILCLHGISIGIRILICTYFYIYIILNALQQIARGLSLNLIYSMSTILSSVINVLLIIVCVQYKGLGLMGILIALVVANIVSVMFIFFKGKFYSFIDFHFIRKESLFQMLKYSWPMIPNSLSMWAMNLSDRLVLSVALGLEAVAVYAVANKIPSLFTVVQSTFTLAWQENASMASGDADAEEYYSHMFDIIFCLMIGVMSILIAVTPILFFLLIRGDYSEAYDQMPILFMGIFFSCISSYLGGIYVAEKRTKNVGITTIIASALNLLLDIILIHFIGIYAASISTLVSFVFLMLYRMFDVQRFKTISFKWKKVISTIGILVVMCAVCIFQSFLLDVLNIFIAICLSISLNYPLLKNIWHMVVQGIKIKD